MRQSRTTREFSSHGKPAYMNMHFSTVVPQNLGVYLHVSRQTTESNNIQQKKEKNQRI